MTEEAELLNWLLEKHFNAEDGRIVEKCLYEDAGKIDPVMNARLILWLHNNKGENNEQHIQWLDKLRHMESAS